jgi:hypothetical protein
MGRLLRWLVLTFAALFLSAVFLTWFNWGLQRIGWSDDPIASFNLIGRFIVAVTGETAFPWVGGFVVGLAFGLWADVFLCRLRSGQSKADRMRALTGSF